MKLFINIIIAACLLVWTSCSVYEDVTFTENGVVKYQLTIDASAIAQNIPNFSSQMTMPADTTISFQDILKDQIDTTSLSTEDKLRLSYISPLSLSFSGNNEKALIIRMFGDFDNVEKLNYAFEAMRELASKGSQSEVAKAKSPVDPTSLTLMQQVPFYTWDNKTMTRATKMTSKSEDRIKNDKSLEKLFSGGKMIINYHFPTEIDKVNNPDAVLSEDQKSVTIEYPASAFVRTYQETDIEIRMK